jgi:O-antigen/teichoic acid export membrane protein
MMSQGFGVTIVRYIAHYNTEGKVKKQQQLILLALVCNVISCLMIIIAGIVMKLYINDFFGISKAYEDEAIAILIALLTQAAFVFLFAIFRGIIQGHSRYKVYKFGLSISLILKFVVAVVLIFSGASIVVVTWIEVAIHFVLLIYFMFYCLRKLKFKIKFKIKMPKEFIKEIIKYSLTVNLGVIVNILYWKTDPILLGRLMDANTITHYNISSSIVVAYLGIASSFSGVFLPKITNLVASGKSNNTINEYYMKASRYLYIIVGFVLCAFITLGKQFIYHWVGSEYNDSFIFSLIIMISLLIPLSQSIGIHILYAKHKHTVYSVIYLVIALINIIISIILIKKTGALGAAIGTAVGQILGPVIAMNIYYKKVINLNIREFFKKVMARTSISLILSGVLILLINKFIQSTSMFVFIVKTLLLVLSYVMLIYMIVLKDNEKNILKRKICSMLRIKNK